MGWERRRNGLLYFYKARRVNGRVVREYFGRGPLAEVAAAEVAASRRERAAQRSAQLGQQRSANAVVALVQELSAGVDLLLRAALSQAGYHQHHRGEWRRQRGESKR